jgi:hypothetical protein
MSTLRLQGNAKIRNETFAMFGIHCEKRISWWQLVELGKYSHYSELRRLRGADRDLLSLSAVVILECSLGKPSMNGRYHFIDFTIIQPCLISRLQTQISTNRI